MTFESRILGGLFGLVVGDALGVPVQFVPRAEVRGNPVTGMDRAGPGDRPPGTWSDDSSMALATAVSLAESGWDPRDIMERFKRWYLHGAYTPHGKAWDIGGATRRALERYASGVPVELAGGHDERDNGNGALMRVLPVALYHAADPPEVVVERARVASALTHAHVRSQLCCAIHCLVVHGILEGAGIRDALSLATAAIDPLVPAGERAILGPILSGEILDWPEDDIESSGYVIHTLGAALWCCARHKDYRGAVLEAVNLGGDADTTGAVAGGLAGVLHGADAIPAEWIQGLERPNVVWHLAHRFAEAVPVPPRL